MSVIVDFCGEKYSVSPTEGLTIGRDADVSVDDNQFLHRRFLYVHHVEGVWILSNVGSQLTATVSDGEGRFEAFLGPGGHLPLAFARTIVRFTAGSTVYELELVSEASLVFDHVDIDREVGGETTIGRTSLTPSQKLLIVALAEPMLRGDGRAFTNLPSTSEAARRLGWTTTKFNRKLDAICQKMESRGIRGLHGGPERLAANRRARLVEYALAVGLVSKDDIGLLPNEGAGELM